ncbi:hypothetical protein [Isoptericola sp. NPDC057191]|uniref:hypothetical protein n=1 Tax=Isoptericola sp. NPDC057191 TaxID=3346041 RepID=UPI003630ECD4
MRSAPRALTAAVVALGMVGAGASAALAAPVHEGPSARVVAVVSAGAPVHTWFPTIPVTTKSVVNKKRIAKYYTDRSKQIGRCTITTRGGRCTISRGKTATRTIETSFGVSRKSVAASLGFSSSTSVTMQQACTSPSMKKGKTWKAWAQGSRYHYKVQPKTRVAGFTISGKKSKWLYAFDPNPNDITCGLK